MVQPTTIFLWMLVGFLSWIVFTHFLKETPKKEFMTDNMTDNIVEYKVIHMTNKKDRANNIKNNETMLLQPIHIFPAVVGDSLDESHLDTELQKFDPRLKKDETFTYKTINEIGCYLSHMMILKEVIEKPSPYKYTVVFEDDFIFTDDLKEPGVFHQTLMKHLDTIDPSFDLLFLGFLGGSNGACDHTAKGVLPFCTNQTHEIYGTQGLVIHNAHARKIYEKLLTITNVIDVAIFHLFTKNELNGYVVEPQMVHQDYIKYGSTILHRPGENDS